MIKKYEKLIYCIIIFFIFSLLTIFIRRYFEPFFVIVILFFFCNPVYKITSTKIFSNKKFSAIISVFFVNVILFIIIILLSNNIAAKYNLFMTTFYSDMQEFICMMLEKLKQITGVDFFSTIIDAGSFSVLNPDILRKGAVYTTEGLFAYIIANIAVYFIMVDKQKIIDFFSTLINVDNLNFARNNYNHIINLIKIELILVVITTMETILGFLILNIKNAVLLGIVSGILDILPYVGTIVVFFPLILYNIYLKQYVAAVGLICLYIILFISRQIMETKYVSRKMKIHPLSILISLYIGIKLFGIIGLFIGPIYVITVKEAIISR